MSKPDDLEAVRSIAAVLEPFDDQERQRILRWVREKLGMKEPVATIITHAHPSSVPPGQPSEQGSTADTDIKTFVTSKTPANDIEFIATVAYFYRFAAPEAERKESIGSTELVDACRKVPWKQPSRPNQALINAERTGYIDKVATGTYRINSVGENLVAMVLSGKVERSSKIIRKSKPNARSTKRK